MSVLRAAANLVLGAVDAACQLLVPPAPNRVCYRSLPDYADNAYYVYRHALRTRHGLDHVWLVLDPDVAGRIRREFDELTRAAGTTGHTLRVLDRRTLRGYWHYLRSRRTFHTHGTYPFARWAPRRDIVCLWHGMPLKCIGALNRTAPNPYPTFGTLHVATSAFFRGIIAAAFRVPLPKVLLCSLPRNDALRPDADRTAAAAAVARVLPLAPGRKLVLWLPTYRAERPDHGRRSFLDDLPAGMLAALDAACERHGCAIAVKLHPLDLLNDSPAPAGLRHVHWIRAADWQRGGVQLYDLVAASDALLSDVSSILVDYLVTGRPIGVVGFDPATYTRELTLPAADLAACTRFRALPTPAAVDAFFADVAAGRAGAPRDEVAARLYEPFAEPGAAAVLRAVGL